MLKNVLRYGKQADDLMLVTVVMQMMLVVLVRTIVMLVMFVVLVRCAVCRS